MTALNATAVLNLALGAGFTRAEANVMVVIAHYESGWDPANVGDQTLSRYGSIGLWQIFTGAHTPSEFGLGTSGWNKPLIAALAVPATNAKAARKVFEEQGFGAWSTYNSFHGDAAWAALLAQVERLVPGGAVNPPSPVAKVTHPQNYLALLGNANKRAAAGLEYLQHEEAHPLHSWKDLCASLCRNAYGIDITAWGDHTRTATVAAHLAGPLHTWYDAPAGVPVYWTGGSTGAGHVAVSDGKGNVHTNDFGPDKYHGDGRVRLVPQRLIVKQAPKLVPAGWGELFLGTRIYN